MLGNLLNFDINEPIRSSELSGTEIAMFFGAFGIVMLALFGLMLFIAKKRFRGSKFNAIAYNKQRQSDAYRALALSVICQMDNLIPVVKSFDCADYDPIEQWAFDDPTEVEFWLSIEVGIESEAGSNLFQVHVVTQKMLSQIYPNNHLLILPYYSWADTLSSINKVLSTCSDVSWEGMFNQVSKHFCWEYEQAK